MLRRLVINGLYDWAKVLTWVADSLAPPCDNIWRSRQWRLWNSQRGQQHRYQGYIPAHNCHETHDATRP